MIGNSLLEYIGIRLSITVLRLVAPTSIGYLMFCSFRPEYFVIPIGVVAAAESSFYLLVYLPRRRRLQASPTHTPLSLTKEERHRIFAKCIAAENTSDSATPYPTGWFLPNNTIPKRQDVINWLFWALFSATSPDRDGSLAEEYKEEIDSYIEQIEERLGTRLEEGNDGNVRSMRITLDPVNMLHRPLVWYSIVAMVDTYTSLYLTFLGFKHYSPRKWNWRHSFPPRPILSLLSRAAPEGVVFPYWYRPHRSPSKLPLVFLHGIGIGLFPYIPFIRSIVNANQDPDIGILLPELLPITMHMTPQAVASRSQMLSSLNIILENFRSIDHVGWSQVVLSAHSYGTFIAGWIVRDCFPSSESMENVDSLIDKIAHLVFVDPIPILISNPSVAHNFLYREPWTTTASTSSTHWYPSYSAASSWQLWYFASRDADVARTLCRSFFWSEGGMWREEVAAFLRRRRPPADDQVSLATYHDEVGGECVSPHNTGIVSPTSTTITQHHQRRNFAVVLGGSDQIIPAEAIRRYLTKEGVWKRKWVGSVVDDSQMAVLNKVGEEVKDEGTTGQLEVLYDPKLDHAKIFDDEEDMIPLLEVIRRYVHDV